MTQPVNLIDADIKGFFDNVMSHSWLMKFLQVRIEDRASAADPTVSEGGLPGGGSWRPSGDAAGNLSPILSNIFLHYVLDLWFEKRLKRQVRGACFLVRYADDFVCMVQYQDDAQRCS